MEKQTHWKTIADMPYLGAYALVGKKELVLTIKDIKQELVIGNAGKKETCIVAYFSEPEKPMILNRTNCKTISKIYDTPIIENWIGKKITVFASTTSLMGETVECLRVRPYAPTQQKSVPKCAECGCEISPAGKMSAEAVAVYTEKKYGAKLCAECAKTLKNQIEQAEEIAEKQAKAEEEAKTTSMEIIDGEIVEG